MKNAHSRTSLLNVHTKSYGGYGDKTQMSFIRKAVRCLPSHVIVDAIADKFLRILLVPNVVLNSQFSRNHW